MDYQQTKLYITGDDGSGKELICNVKEFYRDRILFALDDASKEDINLIQEGDNVHVKIFTLLGIKQFDSIILDLLPDGKIVVEFADSMVSEIQRRKYLRVKMVINMLVTKQNNKRTKAQSVDISGGGVKFASTEIFEPGEIVSCELFLPLLRASIVAEGIILNNDDIDPSHFVLMFTNINEPMRDKIINECFKFDVQSRCIDAENV